MHALLLLILCSSFLVAPAQDADRRRPLVDPYVILPLPMSADELPRVSRILMLSDAQDAALDSLFKRYQQSIEELVPQINDLSRREHDRGSVNVLVDGQWVMRDPPRTMQELYDLATGIVRDTRGVEVELRRIEEEFFAGLEAILAESQRDRLHEARRNRKRVAYQVRSLDPLPGAQADLIQILQSLDVPFEEDESLRELIASYEERLVQSLQLWHEARPRAHLGDLHWLATYSGTGRIDQQAIEARGRIRVRQMRHESAIRRLNMSTLEALSFMLDEQAATEVLDRFYRIAHPRFAPEACPARTRTVLHDALSADELPDDIRAEIEYLRERFLVNHRRLQRRLSDLDFDHTERFYRTLSAHVDDFAAHEAGIEGFSAEIRALCEQTAQRVEQLLTLLEEQ